MRVLLVNTNRMQPPIAPIGLDYLADAITVSGHDPRLLDLCFAEDVETEIHRTLRGFAPQVMGVSIRNTDDCYFSGQAFFLPEIKRVIGLLRQASDAPVVLGGVGFSTSPCAAMDLCEADFGIAGEGELAFVELLRALDERTDLAHVPNLIHRSGNDWRRNAAVPANLADLPPRRRTFADNARYFRKGGQAGFETKRGCPMRCVYCADPVSKGHATRLRLPAAVAAELAALLDQGIDHFHTCDSEFNLPRAHALEVCRAILQAGLGNRIRWYAYCTPTPFDDEMADLFQRAGCAGINFGADSGNNAMLRRLRRHFMADDLVRTAEICHRHRLSLMFDLLLGAPGETPATIRETIDLMKRLEPDCVGLSLGVRLYDGTPLTKQIQDTGGLPAHDGIHGAKEANPGFLKPVFYIAPEVGENISALVRELVAGDPRFFLPDNSAENANYNYNDNSDLVRAIENGARGAYWDILRHGRKAAAPAG